MPFEKRILFIAFGALLICSALYITDNTLPRWGKQIDTSNSYTLGLWTKCILDDAKSVCTDTLFNMSPDRHKIMIVARVFITASCILSSLSTVFILLIVLINEDFKRIVLILGKILSIGSLIVGIVGVTLGIIYVVKQDGLMGAFDLDLPSILAIVSVAFNLFGTIFATLLIQ